MTHACESAGPVDLPKTTTPEVEGQSRASRGPVEGPVRGRVRGRVGARVGGPVESDSARPRE
jgi:hypothetical protein